MLVAHGYNFIAEELLLLIKTFESVSSGSLELKPDDESFAFDERI